MLPRLERPDKVERLVRERHLERVCHLKGELVAESGGGGELVGALRLVRRQRDADAVAPERAGDVARRAPDAAADPSPNAAANAAADKTANYRAAYPVSDRGPDQLRCGGCATAANG